MRRFLSLLALVGCSTASVDKSEAPIVEDPEPVDTGELPVDADGDGYTVENDCDDADATVYPGAEELCDGKDNDCDGHSDADDDVDVDGTADCADYCPVYAAPGATGDGRIGDPFGALQDAIDFAASTGCNEVRADKGTFYENLDWGGSSVNVESLSGPQETFIDGQGLDSVVVFQSGEGEDARISGFTIRNGGGGDGVGVRIADSGPTIEGNLITGNVATGGNYLGGGIRVYEGDPAIVGNWIAYNDAGYGGPENGSDGGGINIRGGAPYIAENWITDNTAGDGGGIWVAYADAIIVNNVISGNWAWDDDLDAGGQGGGINVQIGGPSGLFIGANVVSDNVAAMFGGGIVTYEANATYPYAEISNNTLAFNEVIMGGYGAGLCQWSRTTPTVKNNIVAFNAGVGVYSDNDMDATFTYNLVYGNTTDYDGLSGDGAGNLSVDPLFATVSNDADWTNDDFTLASGSPAIDAGEPGMTDPDGTPSDLGAFGGPFGAW